MDKNTSNKKVENKFKKGYFMNKITIKSKINEDKKVCTNAHPLKKLGIVNRPGVAGADLQTASSIR